MALFTGAGASKAFEFPLTGELFPEIRRRLIKNQLFGRGKKAPALHEQLRSFLHGIYPGLGDTPDADLPLITDILSLLDHSIVGANALMREARRRDMQHFRRLLERAIYKALDWETDYDEVPQSLTTFVNSLFGLKKRGIHAGLISTNYDPLVEIYLFNRLNYGEIRKSFDFGCEWRDDASGNVWGRPAAPTFSIFKLHGSLNMLRCPLCDHIYINLDGAISHLDYDGTDKPRGDGWNQCHCEYAPLEACMIAPSSVRDIREPNMLGIWRHSLEFLRKADDWIIIGYSFPPEDLGIRSLFCRAFQGRTKKPRITVVQAGCDAKTVARYKLMFPDCRYEKDGMAGFVNGFTDVLEYIPSLPRIREIAVGKCCSGR